MDGTRGRPRREIECLPADLGMPGMRARLCRREPALDASDYAGFDQLGTAETSNAYTASPASDHNERLSPDYFS